MTGENRKERLSVADSALLRAIKFELLENSSAELRLALRKSLSTCCGIYREMKEYEENSFEKKTAVTRFVPPRFGHLIAFPRRTGRNTQETSDVIEN